MNEQIKQFFSLKRRTFVAGMAATSVAFGSSQVFGSSKIKVAGIYTQPIQQKWDARLHLALDAAANRGDIDYSYSEKFQIRIMSGFLREYCEKGVQLIVGRLLVLVKRQER